MALTLEDVQHDFKALNNCGDLSDILTRYKASQNASERTVADYTKVAEKRLDLAHPEGGKLLKGVSRQSWDHHRAALRFVCARIYFANQIDAIKHMRSGDLETATANIEAARRALFAYARVVDSVKPDERTDERKSKRKTLPKLVNWQSAAWDIATPAMRPALACLWVGARPQEVEDGVKIEREAGAIAVTINGAKTTDHSGQPWRTLRIDPASPAGKALSDVLGVKQSVTVERRAKRISLDFSSRIRPQMGANVSAYSFRHQFSADLKAAGWSVEDIARAMGHLSTESATRYGTSGQGTAGGGGLLSVAAARDPVNAPDQTHDFTLIE